jgi:arsenate reductase
MCKQYLDLQPKQSIYYQGRLCSQDLNNKAHRTPSLQLTVTRIQGRFWHMNIQIFGTLKCQDTKKAQRYFRERRIAFQFIDVTQKGLSKGELNSIKAAVGLENIIDREGKAFARKNLKYLVHDIEEELLKDPLLLRTPIVRNGRDATAGYQPDVWKIWK